MVAKSRHGESAEPHSQHSQPLFTTRLLYLFIIIIIERIYIHFLIQIEAKIPTRARRRSEYRGSIPAETTGIQSVHRQ